MKIVMTVDPEIPVPPLQYGGIERIVDGLASEYKAKGHEVILVAHPDSSCAGAKEIIPWRGSSSFSKKDTLKNATQLFQLCQQHQPDIIHSFSRLLYLYPIFLWSKYKVVQSYQRAINPLSTQLAQVLAKQRLQLVACASHMFAHLPHNHGWKAIYNFANSEKLIPPSPDLIQDYLVFLGRIEDIKGTKEAIEVALRTGEKLIIAGNIPKEHQQYFDQYIQPQLDDNYIRYIGPVDDQQKLALLQGAKALLFPIKWAEPFGIVMAESYACGTPVIAFNVGSVPEVVQHGVSGWICNDQEDMVRAIGHIHELDRNVIRQVCLQSFSAKVIAQQYLNVFNEMLETVSA